MRPMLATHTDAVPAGREWVHEVKWDGWRVVTEVRGGSVRLFSRSERDVTSSFPELQGLVLPDLVLDGEIVALDDSGRPSLHALAHRIAGPRAARPGQVAPRPVTVMLFDVMALDGHDLTDEPWHRRRDLLEALAPSLEHDRWLVPEVYEDGAMLLEVTRERGLEGVVSKRRSSPYRPGQRSPHWRKRPHRATRSVVVGGWRTETGSRDRLGAVLVGEPTPGGGLRLLGRVGSGLAGRTGEELLALLRGLDQADCPFDDVPRTDADGATWVRPHLVIDVESLGLAGQGRLRQPAYRGVRPDLTASDLVDEHAPEHTSPARETLDSPDVVDERVHHDSLGRATPQDDASSEKPDA